MIEKLQYSDDEERNGTAVNILYDVKITKPIITDDMVELNEEELQLPLMIIRMLESLI